MKPLYVVIVGCGRLGRLLANGLSEIGHQVVVVDRDASRFARLSTEFSGFTVEGDAVELSVLRQAGIEDADCLFATTNLDNVNLMVTQVARNIFGVQSVIARVFDPAHAEIYRQFEVRTISPTKLSEAEFMNVMVEEFGESVT
ncbi:MAG: TrkA family potassium uptake protein [Anaerolineales bacterium]|nr:TrkA family potassium uptake protein [Anaerolineales bacterium]